MYIDSHCHLNMLDAAHYDKGLDGLMQAARDAGVSCFLCVGTDVVQSKAVIALAHQYPDVYASVGLHPSDCQAVEEEWDAITALAEDVRVIAIGETGLDYHYNETGHDTMQMSFRRHIQLAKERRKPLIIHTRDAREDTMDILRQEHAEEAGGIMHCFTENWAMAKAALDLGFYISISGIVTFKRAENLVEVVKKIPMDRCLIETDCPYLAPVPYRGKQNEPKYVTYVAEKIAAIRNTDVEAVARQTSENFNRLFFQD